MLQVGKVTSHTGGHRASGTPESGFLPPDAGPPSSWGASWPPGGLGEAGTQGSAALLEAESLRGAMRGEGGTAGPCTAEGQGPPGPGSGPWLVALSL